MSASWTEFTRSAVEGYCAERGIRTFTLRDFLNAARDEFQQFAPKNRFIDQQVRKQLQILRDSGIVTFVDGRGTYTLRTAPVLPGEVDADKVDFLRSLRPQKREYLIEVFARDRGWVALARKHFGSYCLIPDCENTFKTPKGIPYVEVHHIQWLCEGGEQALWNLGIVCAHHHRMAHFAEKRARLEIANILRSIVHERCPPPLRGGR